MTLPSGIITGMSQADYRADPGVSQSMLKPFAISQAQARWEHTHPRPATRNMQLGTVVDSMVFGTPCNHTTSPFDSFRTDKAREWKAAQEAKGVIILTQDELAMCKRMADKSAQFPIMQTMGKMQAALFHGSGIERRKGLLDWTPNKEAVIVDLKCCEDCSARGFANAVSTFGYDIQAAWYIDLWQLVTGEAAPRQFGFVCIEWDEPHRGKFWIMPDEWVNWGRVRYRSYLETYQRCVAADEWPGESLEPEYLPMPGWIGKEMV